MRALRSGLFLLVAIAIWIPVAKAQTDAIDPSDDGTAAIAETPIAETLDAVLDTPQPAAAIDADVSPNSALPPGITAPNIEAHVVKLLVTTRRPDLFRPWTKASPSKISGSGVILRGGKILTNAHVVTHASEVLVQLRQGGDRLPASVVAIAPGMDLAVVELDDPVPLESLAGLELAVELPQPKSRVSVYGYPTGGNDLSVTTGIVSRIEFTSFYHSSVGVRVQVDAALNSGNSGGPAIQEGKIAGLVFSKIEEADNIGYLIPPEEIRTFLDDVADGSYEGKPMLLDRFQTAENKALRKYLKVPRETTGIVVSQPNRDDEDYPLRKWDVVTHIGPHAIDNQSYVEVRPGLRLQFLYYVPKLQQEGKVELTLIRDGEEMKVKVPVQAERERLIPTLKDKYPEYFIYGPLVFTSASSEYVRSLGARGLAILTALDSPILKRLYDRPAEPGEQLVVIATRMFPHRITQGYSNRAVSVVERINGHRVKNLRQMAELLRDSKEEFLKIELAGRSESLVFRRTEIEKATEEIVVDEGIRYRASKNLRDVWPIEP